MATTPTTRVTDLARRNRLDIDTATYPASAYSQLMGVEEAKLSIEPRTEDDEVYEDEGALRKSVTGYSWKIEVKLAHSRNPAGSSRDTVHAFMRTRFLAAARSSVEDGEFGVRWYDRNGLGSGHEGRVFVESWAESGGKGRETIDLVLQGQGPIADITNPNGSLLPAVESLSPTGGPAAGGTLVQIAGHHFTGATAVAFGGTAATSFTIVNDSMIVATSPAKAAGSYAVRVTNPAGQSADTAADDFLYA